MDDLAAAARQMLGAPGGRGAMKRLAARLDADPALRIAVLEQARRAGVSLPDEASDWPGKRLLRRARGREEAARRRTNPIARDEAFTCGFCGRWVPPLGRTARDHCPGCLYSQHVDEVPGDRAATCHGLLQPTGITRRGEQVVLHYRCLRCGAERVNRAALEGATPDDWDAILAVAAHR